MFGDIKVVYKNTDVGRISFFFDSIGSVIGRGNLGHCAIADRVIKNNLITCHKQVNNGRIITV